MQSLSSCNAALFDWGEKHFGDLPKEIKKCKDELGRLQLGPQDDDVVHVSRILENQISALLRKEEVFWLKHFRV
ncbi:hypothetical protein ACS0TY_033509 [Phlomoides rotata]